MRRIYTWEGEFYALDHAEAKTRLAAGIELFRRRGWPLHGFVAPAWLMSAGTRQALGERLRYTSDPSNLYLLPHLQPIEAPAWSGARAVPGVAASPGRSASSAGLIGASLIPLVLGGSDMFPRLRAFPLDSLLLMFGMIVVCWFINGPAAPLLAGRAGKLGQLQSVGIIMASEFAFCATPGGSGGPLTLMALLARRAACAGTDQRGVRGRPVGRPDVPPRALGAILIYALSHSLSPNMESSLIFSAVFLVGLFVGAVMLIRYLHQVIRFNGRVLARLGVSSRKRLHWGRKILHFRIALHDSLRRRNDACWRSSFSAVRTGCCASACSI